MATIDRLDRHFILMLNNNAAVFRRLAEVTVSPEARGIYLGGMLRYEADLDRAVEKALRRAS